MSIECVLLVTPTLAQLKYKLQKNKALIVSLDGENFVLLEVN